MKILKSNKLSNQVLGILLALPAIILIGVVTIRPLIINIWRSFFRLDALVGDLKWVYIGLDNFQNLLKNKYFFDALENSIVLTITVTTITVIIALVLALLLENQFYGRNIVRSIFILPWAMPVIVAAFAWRFIADPSFGILNHWLLEFNFINKPINWLAYPNTAWFIVISANVWKGLPYVLLVTIAALKNVPEELIDSAKVDGASYLKIVQHVILPSISGILSIAILLRFIWFFNWFDLIWLLTGGGPGRSTEVLPIIAYRTAFLEAKWGRASAIATVMFFVLLILVIIYYRYKYKREQAVI